MPAFLTDDWFSTVETLTAQAGEFEPAASTCESCN
jgi:hypothetical protein